MLFVFLVSLGFGACSNDHYSPTGDLSLPSVEIIHTHAVSYSYERTSISIGNAIHNIDKITTLNGTVYGVGFSLDDNQVATYHFFLMDLELETTYYYPLHHMNSGYRSVLAMEPDGLGNIFFVEQEFLIDELDMGVNYFLKKINLDGNILLSVNLNDYLEIGDEMLNIAIDEVGNIYVQSFTQIFIFDERGTFLFSVEIPGEIFWGHHIFSNINGNIFLPVIKEGSAFLYSVDLIREELMQANALPDASLFRPSISSNEVLLLTRESLQVYSPIDGTLKEQFNWLDLNLTFFDVFYFSAISDGQYVFLDRSSNLVLSGEEQLSNAVTQVSVLTRVEAREDAREVITLLSISPNLQVINAFNQWSDQYRIQVIDYSAYRVGGDLSNAITRLQTDLVTGQVPDILDLTGLSYRSLVQNNFLEDLYPFFAQDESISLSVLIDSIPELLMMNEGLYAITPSFAMATMLAPTSFAGEDQGITLDALAQLEEFFNDGNSLLRGMNAMTFLHQYSLFNWNVLVDYDNGNVYFDTDDFIAVLEYAARLDHSEIYLEHSAEDYLRWGENLAFFAIIENLSHLHYIETISAQRQMTALGFPTTEGVGSLMLPSVLYGIGAGAQNTSGAWEFIRFLLSEEQQRSGKHEMLPVIQTVYEEQIQSLLSPIRVDHPELATGVFVDGIYIEFTSMTQEHADRLFQIILNLRDMPHGGNAQIMDIVLQEANPFLHGDRTAQDTARIIQNRVQTYISEQMR